jgi:hypothetical protein
MRNPRGWLTSGSCGGLVQEIGAQGREVQGHPLILEVGALVVQLL